jgi:uncharacterized membrane protein YgdD (TMEM256/DUF423 family)
VAAILGFSAVALGAFGAHALKRALASKPDAADRAGWWQTGSQYHLAHALAVGLAAVTGSALAAWLFLAGIALFSGSLYVMTITGKRALGAVTPLGGLGLLAGWVMLGVDAIR